MAAAVLQRDQPARRSVKGKHVTVPNRKDVRKDELHQHTEEIVKFYVLSMFNPTARRGHRYSAIQQSCAKVAKDYERKLSELCERLKLTKESLHSNFVKVFGSLFTDGITVGKILISIAFGGRLITYCTEKGLNVTDNLTAWILDYFKNYITDWIINYGGWEKIEKKIVEGHPPLIQWSSLLLDTLTVGFSVFNSFMS